MSTDRKLDELPAGDAVAAADLFYSLQGGVSVRQPATALRFIGGAEVVVDGFPSTAQTQLNGSAAWAQSFVVYGNNGSGVDLAFAKTRGSTAGVHVAVGDGDELQGVWAYGSDGSGFISGAHASFVVDGPVSNGNVPTSFDIYTGENNYGTLHVRVGSNGKVGINTSSPTAMLDVNVPAASNYTGIKVTQNVVTGTVTGQNLDHNSIRIDNDVANVATAGTFAHGLHVFLGIGTGPGAVGSRYGIKGESNLGGAGNDTAADVVGVSGIASSSQSNGGTNTGAGAAGTLYGLEGIGQALSGATNYLVVSGGEVDAIINTGGTAKHRWGWSIVGNGDVQGVTTDAALEIGGVTSAGKWKTGILFDSVHGFAPVATSGTLIGTDGTAFTVTNGFDLSAITISGFLLKSTPINIGGGALTNAANDAAAAGAGVAVGQMYRNGSVLMIRVA